MQKRETTKKSLNSKGASIFKKMLEDKNAIHQHLQKGGKLSDLKINIALLSPYH